jgi:hypothetical protein
MDSTALDGGSFLEARHQERGSLWGKSLGPSNLAFDCLWPTLRVQLGTAVRNLIENSTPAAERGVCPVDLKKLTDRTILGPSVE